jgi:hypothetical protein
MDNFAFPSNDPALHPSNMAATSEAVPPPPGRRTPLSAVGLAGFYFPSPSGSGGHHHHLQHQQQGQGSSGGGSGLPFHHGPSSSGTYHLMGVRHHDENHQPPSAAPFRPNVNNSSSSSSSPANSPPPVPSSMRRIPTTVGGGGPPGNLAVFFTGTEFHSSNLGYLDVNILPSMTTTKCNFQSDIINNNYLSSAKLDHNVVN